MHSARECPVGTGRLFLPLHFDGLILEENARDSMVTALPVTDVSCSTLHFRDSGRTRRRITLGLLLRGRRWGRIGISSREEGRNA